MMFSWVRRGLRTGIVTTRYPATHDQMPSSFRGRPLLDPDRCRAAEGCDACVQVCLPGALRLETQNQGTDAADKKAQDSLMLDLARCITCGLCVTACPEDALRMTSEYELATSAREALQVTALLVLQDDLASANGKEEPHGPHEPSA